MQHTGMLNPERRLFEFFFLFFFNQLECVFQDRISACFYRAYLSCQTIAHYILNVANKMEGENCK